MTVSTALRLLAAAILLALGMAGAYERFSSLQGWRWPWWWYNHVVEMGRPAPPEAVWCVRAGWTALAVIVVCSGLRWWRGAGLKFDRCDWIILTLPAWLLFTGFWLGLPRPLIHIGLWPQVAVLLLYFLGRSTGLELRGWSAACIFVAAVLAVTVLLDAEGLMHRAPQRPGGLLASRNFAGQYLALTLPALLVWGWRIEATRRHGLRVLYAACAVLIGVALVLTRSRTAWIGASVGTVFILVFACAPRRLVVLPLAFVMMGALIGGYLPTKLVWKDAHPFWTSASRIFDISSGSGAFRRDQYRDTLRIAASHPVLGVGPAGWSKAIAAVNPDPQHHYNHFPNSDYLRFLCEGGFVGLALFIGVGTVFLHRAWKLRREQPQVFATLAALGLICASDAVFVRAEASALLCALLAALVNHSTRLSPPQNSPSLTDCAAIGL